MKWGAVLRSLTPTRDSHAVRGTSGDRTGHEMMTTLMERLDATKVAGS